MPILPNSYGTAAGVAALRPIYTKAGAFDTTTNPALATVENLVDQVSAMLNSMLSSAGFTVPVTQSDAVLMLTMFVEAEVADVVDGIRGVGKFGPADKKTAGTSRFTLLLDDVSAFVKGNKIGLQRMGVPMPNSIFSEIATRSTDNAGDATDPIFQRKAFGNVFDNWDRE
jgi:hypothetical protein